MAKQTDDLVSPNATDTVFNFGFEIKFGSPPLYTNPFLFTPRSPLPSDHISKYIDRINTFVFTESEQAIILKLDLDWVFHTEWPAFHWDADALESSARDWEAGSRDKICFDVDADASLDLEGECPEKGIEAVVGPQDSRSRSNSVVAVPAPVADDSDEVSGSVGINPDPAEDDVKGEDIPRYGTPDFEILRSSPSTPSITPIPTNIPLPLSRLGSEDSSSSSEYSESASYDPDLDWDLDYDSEWYWLHSLSACTRSSSSVGFTLFDIESGPVEIEETELPSMIGSSLLTLLNLDESESEECFGQDDEKSVLIYSSGHEVVSASDITLSSEASFGSSNLDVEEPTKIPMDPIKLSKLTQLSTIPVAGDPSLLLLLSTLAIPPFPESESATQPTEPPSPQLHIFKKDAESCTKLEIMETQGVITNEVGAQLRCGCDGCRPVAMKALFGDWSWPLDGGRAFSNEKVLSSEEPRN